MIVDDNNPKEIMNWINELGLAERIIPGFVPLDSFLEHISRYIFALAYVKNKRVLDIACGTGYGSYFLTQKNGAKFVVGGDISKIAINYAKNKYIFDNLEFEEVNVLNMSYPPNYFDIIVSFETIEHVENYIKVLEQFNRILKKNGVLIISIPNKIVHEIRGIINPYHINMPYFDELKTNLEQYYEILDLYGQRPVAIKMLTSNQSFTSKIKKFVPKQVKKNIASVMEAHSLGIPFQFVSLYYSNPSKFEEMILNIGIPDKYIPIKLSLTDENEDNKIGYEVFLAIAKKRGQSNSVQ